MGDAFKRRPDCYTSSSACAHEPKLICQIDGCLNMLDIYKG